MADRMSYELGKFFNALIPDIIVSKLPTIVGSVFVSALPWTPLGLILYFSIFITLYLTNIFGMGSKDRHICRYNRHKAIQESSIFWTMIRSYLVYLPIAFVINYNTIFKMQVRLNYIGHTI